MGSARDITTYRLAGPGNQNMDGISNRTAGWIVGTGTYRSRLSNNGAGAAHGSYFNDGETWYGIVATRQASGGGVAGRVHNWHDEPVSGYSWGGVSPVAWDCALPFTNVTGNPTESTIEFMGGCPGSSPPGTTHFNVPFALSATNYYFFFYKIKFKADCTGSFQLYVQNQGAPSLTDGPVVDLTNIRTLNNTAGWFPGVQFWQGMYGNLGAIGIDHMISMWGQSWQQAWDDVPSFVEFQENTTTGNNATCTSLSVINTSTFPIPNAIAAQLSDPPSGGGGGAGSFPTTALLSSFSGADENPLSEGGNWLGSIANGGASAQRLGSHAAGTSSSGSISTWHTAAAFANCEAWVPSVSTLTGSGKGFGVYVRGQNRGNATTAACYLFIYTPGTGFRYFKLTGGTSIVQVGSTFTGYTMQAGNGIGMSAKGTSSTVLQGYYLVNGVGIAVPPFTDSSSPITAAGVFGFDIDDTTGRITGFGGSGIAPPTNNIAPVVSGAPTKGQTLVCTNTHANWTDDGTGVLTHQWQRDVASNGVFSDRAGQTDPTGYLLGAGDIGCTIRCQETDTDGVQAITVSSNTVGPVADIPVAPSTSTGLFPVPI